MARTSPIFNNFTGGERSPKTIGRTDTKAYFSSCSELTNMWVATQGGVEKRPGFKYIATTTTPTGTETSVRLQEFKYSSIVDQNFVLEFTNGGLYFFKNGGAVLTGGGSRYMIGTGISGDYLSSLRFAQMLDEMIITSPYFRPKRLIRYDDNDWEIENISLQDGPWIDQNEDVEYKIRPSQLSGANITFYVEGGEIPEYCYVNSYVKLNQDLTFSGSLTAENTFTGAIFLDAGNKAVVSLAGTWVATAILQKSYDGGTTWYDYLSFTGNTTRELLEVEDNMYYRVGVPTGKFSSGTVQASITKKDVIRKAVITEVAYEWFLATPIDEDFVSTEATYKWSFSAFNPFSGYPKAVAFYEGRLLLAGTYDKPQTIWASKVDDYFNFNTGTDDDDAYSYTFTSSDMNDIMWMVGTDVLRIGTRGGEWKFGKRDEPTTPTNVDVKQHSNNGSANVPGLLIGSSVVYVQRSGTKLRQMYYDYSSDRYLSPEISVIAEHLARKGIRELKFSNNPDPIIWMTTDEGTLVACTYNTDQEIIAFHEHETDGEILSVAVIPGTDRDEVWIAVNRSPDFVGEGSTQYYIEQMTTQFWTNIEDAIYLDSAITAENPYGMTRVAGLTHLADKIVKVITDGSVHPDCEVSWGEGGYGIDLNWSATKVHVGLGYTATVKTMPLEPGVEGGSSVGHKKKGFRIAMGMYRTNHGKVGTSTEDLDIIPFRSSAMNMNQAIPEYTGVRKVWLNKGSADEFSLMAVSDVPLPFALTYISPVVYSSPS